MIMTAEKVEEILSAPAGQYNDQIISLARKRKDELEKGLGGDAESMEPQTADEWMQLINDLIIKDESVSEQQVETLLDKKLKTLKVGIGNISPDLMRMLKENGRVVIEQIINGQAIRTNVGAAKDLFWYLLSERMAGNNVYLYGGAGTGKTYIAGTIAKALKYELITVNCNQFTSPAELMGGQTIDGYQEGKLIRAWGNLDLAPGKLGAVLLLDELPKIDPNTAGVLNAALSTIKDPVDRDIETGEIIPPVIENGRGQKIPLANLFIIGTGNSKLNEADPDYEANFKQDLSLQDRFIGDTYKVYIDYEFELNEIMKIEFKGELWDMTWLWNFLIRIREAIENQTPPITKWAFVSSRLMVNLRDNFMVLRNELSKPENERLKKVKTVQMGISNFLDLFTENQRVELKKVVDWNEFFKVCEKKTKVPISELSTENEKQEAERLIAAWKQRIK